MQADHNLNVLQWYFGDIDQTAISCYDVNNGGHNQPLVIIGSFGCSQYSEFGPLAIDVSIKYLQCKTVLHTLTHNIDMKLVLVELS